MSNRGPSMFLGGVQFGPGRYPTLWVRVDGKEHAIALHRLVAYAYGKLDSIRFAADPREVHHRDGDPWNNRPENLAALDPSDHGRLTRREASD